MDRKPGIEPRVLVMWVFWGLIVWAAIAMTAVLLLGLSAPDGPPAYGYDCDSAYRLKEANCPQDR